jgi:hypothetical protein
MLGPKPERLLVNPASISLIFQVSDKANGLSISPISSELYRASKYLLALTMVSLNVDHCALYNLTAL